MSQWPLCESDKHQLHIRTKNLTKTENVLWKLTEIKINWKEI